MNNIFVKFIGLLFLLCVLTLPFHWIPSEMIIVPKKALTLNKTFVSEDEVTNIVEKYYLGSPKEKLEIANDPLTDKLKNLWTVRETDKGVFFESKDKDRTILKYYETSN